MLLAASFPPALGGVETLLYQTNRRLADPPLVLAPRPAAAPDLPVCAVGLNLLSRAAYRPLWWLHPSLHYTLLFLGPALEAVRRWRPRVIQAGHVYLAPLARVLSRWTRLPYVVYAFGQEVWRRGRPVGLNPLDERLRGAAMRKAAGIVVPGSFTAGLLEDWQVDGARVVKVPYGAEPRPHVPPPSGKSLLSVARLVPRKGIDMVIHALARLPEDVTYRVVGTGPDRQRLQRLAQQEQVADRVEFVGRVDDAQLASEYQRAALFVLPARRTAAGELEGYGLVYFEAAAWGRAVVAGRSGGEIDAVLDGQTGLLVDGTSLESIVAAIRSLLDDRARLTALGEAGRRRVETTHNWSCAAATLDTALLTLR